MESQSAKQPAKEVAVPLDKSPPALSVPHSRLHVLPLTSVAVLAEAESWAQEPDVATDAADDVVEVTDGDTAEDEVAVDNAVEDGDTLDDEIVIEDTALEEEELEELAEVISFAPFTAELLPAAPSVPFM